MRIFEMMDRVWKLVMAAFILLSSSAYAQQINWMSNIKNNPDGSQTLLHHVPREVASGLATKTSHADAGQMLDLRVLMPSKDQAGLDSFVKELYDPKSPNYHKFLTPQQFARQFGASAVDSSLIIEHLKSLGLTVRNQSANGFVLRVSGPVSTVEPAFKVHINNYTKTDGTKFFAPDADPTIPPQIAGKIYAIVGMDNVTRFYPHYRLTNLLNATAPVINAIAPVAKTSLAIRGLNEIIVSGTSASPQVKPAASPAFSGKGGSISPSNIATAYNLTTVTSNGSGQTQAVYELDGYLASDVSTFESYYGLPAVTLTNVIDTTDGATGAAGDNTDEVVLDIDLSVAVAPGLSSILVYEAPNTGLGWIDQWDQIASDDLAKTISCSWGAYEAGEYPYYDHTVFSQLATQGQSVFASSGDAGAYDNCDGGSLPSGSPSTCTINGSGGGTPVLSVDDPASDPYITGVGISTLTVNSNETYNNETASLYGGGGISSYVSIPSYQTTLASEANGAAQVSTTMRNVPDVVLTADQSTYYAIFVTDPNTASICYSTTGLWCGMWGSSAASPIWAAFISRVNQGRVAAGQAVVGFLNPVIYQVAQSSRYTSDFHDISTGSNSYYPAEAGEDDATGLGSFNGANLYSDLIGPAAPTGLTPTAGNGQVVLHWTASSGAGSYNVGRATVSGGPYTTVSTSGAVTTTNYTDTSLTNGTIYYYVVSAVNNAGVEGLNSAQVSETPESTPTAPTAVSATAGNTQAVVTFSGALANGSTITGYTVTSSPGGITGIGTASPITVTGLTNGTVYTFTVTATNGVGTSSASVASNSVTPAGSPTAPTTVSAVAGNTQATVTFSGATANGSTITGYTVTSSPGGITGASTASPITVTGLTDGTAYTFTVTATNGVGTSSASVASNSITPNIVPGAPTGVSATAGNTQATVSFTAPAPNGGSAVLSYTVTSSPGGLTGTGTVSPITVTGLTNGTAYTFTVVAFNATGPGATSAASNSVTPAGLPTAPTTVSAVGGNAQAIVTFSGASANGSPITGYTVTSSPGGLTGAGTASPITVAGLTNGTAYTFTVTATNGIGTSSASVASNSIVSGAPTAPTTVSAAAGNAQAVVTFSGASANGNAITGYTVTSSPGGLTGAGTASPITVTGLTNGTAYTFTVTATNGVGTSPASIASNSVTPAGLPSAPTTVSATAGNTQAVVTFSGASTNGSVITSYTVTSSPDGLTGAGSSSPITVTGLTNGTAYTFTVTATNGIGTSTASSASNSVTPAGLPVAPTTLSATAGSNQATVTFSGASDNGSAITGYTVTSSPGGITGAGSSSPITVTGLTNGIAYTFTVTATNGVGTGTASVASNSVTPAGLPIPPTTVSAVPGNAQATVTFSGASANGSAIISYTVTSNPGSLTATGSGSPITVTGLTNGTAYTFTVTATNGLGTGAASVASNSVIPTPVIPPSALSDTILAARVGGQIVYGGVSLTWVQSTSPDIIQNKIYRSTGSGPYSLIATISASTSYKDTSPTTGTVYNYEVTAYDSNDNESIPSNTVTVNY